jgi:hypothetical protein
VQKIKNVLPYIQNLRQLLLKGFAFRGNLHYVRKATQGPFDISVVSVCHLHLYLMRILFLHFLHAELFQSYSIADQVATNVKPLECSILLGFFASTGRKKYITNRRIFAQWCCFVTVCLGAV